MLLQTADILFLYSLLLSSGRVDDATDSEVRYEIETETKEEMNSVQVSVTGTAYQENNAFSTQFKSAMKTEGVDTDVVASMVGVEPDADAQAVEQDIDGNDMPAETPTNDASNDASNGEDSNGDNGTLYGVIAGVGVVALLVGVVVFVPKNKNCFYRSKHNGHHELEKGKGTIEMNSNPMERPALAVAMGTMNRSPIIDKKKAKLQNDDVSQWDIHLDPKTGNKYRVHKTKGVTEWM